MLSDLVGLGLWLEEDQLCERPTVFHAKRVQRPNKCGKFCIIHTELSVRISLYYRTSRPIMCSSPCVSP